MGQWMILLLVLIVGVALFFLIVCIIDGNRFHVVEYHLRDKRIKREHTFVVMSDLHNKSYGKHNEKLLEKIEKLQPEAILTAGDILTAKPNVSFQTALELIKKLSSKYPIYYGMGNHETRLFLYPEVYGDMGPDFEKDLQKINVEMLKNVGKTMDDSIQITGLDIPRQYYKRFRKTPMAKECLQQLLGTPDKKKYQILIAHNPDYFEEYAAWGADLVLAGHVHGGMVRLPFLGGVVSPAFRLFPKYDGGKFQEGNATMIVSRGLGMHTIPIRIFNPGELIKITLGPER